MAEVAGVDLFPVDIGMVTDVPEVTKPEYKVAYGTEDMMRGPAMTREQAAQAVLNGIRIVRELAGQGYDILATGEMGDREYDYQQCGRVRTARSGCRGGDRRGAGLSSEGIRRKIEVIRESVRLNRPDREDPLDVLSKVGGLDIAGLTGVFLGAQSAAFLL